MATESRSSLEIGKVFISYAHDDDEHKERVRDFWLFLRRMGVDAVIDLPAAERRQDWALWMSDAVEGARYIIVVASPAYKQRAEGKSAQRTGLGVQWEAALIRSRVYADREASLDRIIPVVLPGCSADDLPDWLGGLAVTHYAITEYSVFGADRLLRLLTDQPYETVPPMGEIPMLLPRDPAQPAPAASVPGLVTEVYVRMTLSGGRLTSSVSVAGTVLSEQTSDLGAGGPTQSEPTVRAIFGRAEHRVATMVQELTPGSRIDLNLEGDPALLKIPLEQISLRAASGEGTGPLGQCRGVQLHRHIRPHPTTPKRPPRLRDLLSSDPLTAVPMAHEMVRSEPSEPIDFSSVVDQPIVWERTMTRRVLRYALASDPERSAELLLARVEAANQCWNLARAGDLFSTAHRPFAHERLSAMATECAQFDVARRAIDGLGRIGATSSAAHIVKCAEEDRDAFEKLSNHAAPALARMFHRPGPDPEWVSGPVLDTLGRFLTRHQSQESQLDLFTIYAIFRRLGPVHADFLIHHWLPAENERLVDLAATALGHMRLDRSCRLLADRAAHVSDETARTICKALGYIGTPQAVELLMDRTTAPLSNAAYEGLAICLDRTADQDFKRLVEELLQRERLKGDRWRVYRAIGLQPLPDLLRCLQVGIHSDNWLERAVSAIAIARTEGAAAQPLLLRAQREASNAIEGMFLLLARLCSSHDENLVAELAPELGNQGWQLDDALFEDSVQILREVGSNRGRKLADCVTWIRDAS
ncbi:TIR domain-containing protein [Streptomyces kutzneri]|uniref:TIR domain-containing protein n=1 Tax=Streptomyces kutzneri TaxID=3051179 RepID=UPI0028D27433|nr:TIR domain-containing protein [Streptomyces sp. DSM 40907]